MSKDDRNPIPRLSHWKDANDRLNSAKRRIVKTVAVRDVQVEVIYQGGAQTLTRRADPSADPLPVAVGYTDIDVAYSLQLPAQNLSVVVGVAANDGSMRIAVSSTQASSVRVPEAQTSSCDVDMCDVPRLTILFAYHLMTDYLLSDVQPGDTFMVHEPGMLLSRILARSAAEKCASTYFTTCNIGHSSTCVYIHPYTTESDIRSTIPEHLSSFLDFSRSQSSNIIGGLIAANLPPLCDLVYFDKPFSKKWCLASLGRSEEIHKRLRNAYEKAVADAAAQDLEPDETAISVHELNQREHKQGVLQLLDWRASSTVVMDVQPVDSGSLFTKD